LGAAEFHRTGSRQHESRRWSFNRARQRGKQPQQCRGGDCGGRWKQQCQRLQFFAGPGVQCDTTGSTTTTDARSSFSNFGTCVDLFAPGSGILSAWFTSNTATATLSGTSMASPHVAGVAALYKQANPSASATTVRNAIVNNATTNVVTNAGTGSPNRLLYSLFF
jgi:hypothetical protein